MLLIYLFLKEKTFGVEGDTMYNSVKITKNEFIKFLHGKKFIFIMALIIGMCGIAAVAYKDMVNIVVNNLPKAETYSNEMKYILLHINGVNFSKLFLTDFIYKGYFSFYILFIVLIAADVFSVDNESGNMKFTLLTGVKVSQLFTGKIVYMSCVSFAIVLFHFIVSVIVGQFVFGGDCLSSELVQVLVLSICAVFPAVAIAVIVALLSQFRVSSKTIIGCGIALSLILGVADTLSKSKYLSPIGVLSIFNESVPSIKNEIAVCLFSSGVYLIIGIFILYFIIRKRDYFE